MFDRWLRASRARRAARLLESGSQLYFLSDYGGALSLSERAFDLYRRLGDERGIADAAGGVAGASYYLTDVRRTLRYARIALWFSRRCGDLDGISRALSLIGNIQGRRGNHERAMATHQRALLLAEDYGDNLGIARSLANLGQTFAAMGKYVPAVEHFQRALASVARHNPYNDLFTVRVQNALGGVYRALGENDRADVVIRASLEGAVSLHDEMGESAAATNLSNGLILQRRWREAIDLLKRSIEIKRRLGDARGEAMALSTLAQCLALRGEHAEALRLLERALMLARGLNHRQGEWLTLSGIGLMHLVMGDVDGARRLLDESVALAREFGSVADLSEMGHDLARVSIATGDLQRAAAILEESIKGTESVREDLRSADDFRVSIFERHAEAYHDLQWVFAALGHIDRALEIAERARARALLGAIARRTDTPYAGAPNLAQILATATEQQTTFVVYSLIADPRQFDRIDRETELFTWVVSSDADTPIAFHRSDGPARLAVAESPGAATYAPVEHFMRGDDLGPIDRELEAEYELLIAPISEHLPNDEEELVTFVAEGALLLVPFAALKDAAGRRMIEYHTISVSPSIHMRIVSAAQRRRLESSEDGAALVVGNPSGWERLPDAEREALIVAQIMAESGMVVETFIGPEATKAAVVPRMAHKRLLHFATHGQFGPDRRDSTPGALKLTPEAGDTGLLTADEIASMQLDSDLAVLSACNTGQGRIAAEGLLGLARAFLLAGAPTVVVTLWSIPDEPTLVLMEHFYAEIGSKEKFVSKAHSLRQAMLKAMDAYSAPCDWAAFLLVGSPL